jgi:hypothetical protein
MELIIMLTVTANFWLLKHLQMFGDQWIVEGTKLRYKPVWCMYMSTAIYMMCKSNLSVNHLQLYVKKIYTYTYPVAMCIYFFLHLHLHKASVNICQIHLHDPM